MSRSIMLVPTAKSTGIFTASLGLVKALKDKGVNAALFRPFDCCKNVCACKDSYSVSFCDAVKQIAAGERTELLEKVVANFKRFLADTKADVVIAEGVVDDKLDQDKLNADVCHALDADIVVVNLGKCAKAKALNAVTLQAFGNSGKTRVVGNIILNRNAPKDAHGEKRLVLAGNGGEFTACCDNCAIDNIIADIPFDMYNYAVRAKDIADFIGGKVIAGDAEARGFRVVFDLKDKNKKHVLITETLPTEAESGIVILAKGIEGQLSNVNAVISSEQNVWDIAKTLARMPAQLAADDTARADKAAEFAAPYFDADALAALSKVDANRTPLMSPAAFRLKLTELARAAHKRIALPEGDEPRTVCAAAKVAASGIATPVLFGKKDKILAVAKEQGVTLGEGVQFVDPEEVRMNYVARLVELRKKKGLTEEQAIDMLKDNVVLGTMMLERNEVDGLVSGAVHTTANTIRPPLQIIKTAPNASLVSSVFFMLMPEQVYVFGDCAINPNPTPADLAEIAIQSADTAKTFGIDPRVAMVTYSTGTSGKGPDIDTVTEATRIAKEKRPDLNIDGPLQYDAAVMPNVAAQKAPGSTVAGKATVFIFPSLEVGNVVYKAVQRSADLVSIGPMLQGMRKPVNDLSRGALVDDIIYTIAITAIQATQE